MTAHIGPVFGAYVRAAAAVVLLALLMGCSRTTPAGYWEGKGTAKEIPMKDAFRTLTRSATYDFWFTVGDGGDAVGEIEMVYDSERGRENHQPQPAAQVSAGGGAPQRDTDPPDCHAGTRPPSD